MCRCAGAATAVSAVGDPVRTSLVARVEVIDVALPVRREWRWRGLGEELGNWTLIRLETEDGLVGWGEATALRDWGGDHGRYFGETPATVRHVVEEILAPHLVGLDPFDIEATFQRFDDVVKGYPYAKAAIDIALHDLQGKIAGVPLFRLIGGRVRPGVGIAHMIGIMSIDEALEEAAMACEDGVRAFQVKGTGEIDRDVELVKALRHAVEDGIVLRLDANQGYRGAGAKAAIRAVRRLEEAGVDFVEQPTEGLRDMAVVRAATDVPIIADESAWQPADALEVGRMGAADAISIYLAKAGGIARARKVAAIAETFGLPCDVNGSLESGIGNAANVHFGVSSVPVSLACVIPVTAPRGLGSACAAGRYYADDIVTDAFRFENGILYPPDGPGLGVTVDEEKLCAYRVA